MSHVTCLYLIMLTVRTKDFILVCLDEIFEKTTIQKEETIYSHGPHNEFKNKFMMKGLHYLSKKNLKGLEIMSANVRSLFFKL